MKGIEKMSRIPTVEVIQRQSAVSTTGAKPQKKRVAAYCRVSTEYEEQQSSLEIQMSAFREQIDARPDWKLAGIYADRGISGTQVQNRTEFLRMMSVQYLYKQVGKNCNTDTLYKCEIYNHRI